MGVVVAAADEIGSAPPGDTEPHNRPVHYHSRTTLLGGRLSISGRAASRPAGG
jgi:hypothetical protein